MNFDIYSINSFWIYCLGFTILWTGALSTSQIQVQRSICMPSLKSAKRALVRNSYFINFENRFL